MKEFVEYSKSSIFSIGCYVIYIQKMEFYFNGYMMFLWLLLAFQGYGMTETGGGATTMVGPDEAKHYGSAGRLTANMEAKIVDPSTGEALLPGKEGELWLRGPNVMKGDSLVPNFPIIIVSAI